MAQDREEDQRAREKAQIIRKIEVLKSIPPSRFFNSSPEEKRRQEAYLQECQDWALATGRGGMTAEQLEYLIKNDPIIFNELVEWLKERNLQPQLQEINTRLG